MNAVDWVRVREYRSDPEYEGPSTWAIQQKDRAGNWYTICGPYATEKEARKEMADIIAAESTA